MKMQQSYKRSTTATRRLMRDLSVRYLHKSVTFSELEQINPISGVVSVYTQPDPGSTYNKGRNEFKRLCKRLGVNRVRVERAVNERGFTTQHLLGRAS